MKTHIFLQKTGNLFMENRLLKFVTVILALAVVANSVMVMKAIRYQRTILIPPKLTGTIEFVEGRPSEVYLRDLARSIAGLAATYSPATARAQIDELLAYYAPEEYPKASSIWYALASRVEESRVSSVFYLRKIVLGDDWMEIVGDRSQYAEDRPVEKGPQTYIVRYRIRNGRFYLLSFTEKWQKKEGGQS